MTDSRRLLINTGIILAGTFLASGIYLLLSGERGVIKFVAWAIFFAAIQSPIFFARKSGVRCSLLARLKR
jgi:hypothetical protein